MSKKNKKRGKSAARSRAGKSPLWPATDYSPELADWTIGNELNGTFTFFEQRTDTADYAVDRSKPVFQVTIDERIASHPGQAIALTTFLRTAPSVWRALRKILCWLGPEADVESLDVVTEALTVLWGATHQAPVRFVHDDDDDEIVKENNRRMVAAEKEGAK